MADVYGGITSKELLDRLIRDASPEEKEMIYRSYVVAKAIKELDLVEVVRCKDCKWYERKYPWNDHIYECSYLEAPMDDNDYCSWGERKDEGAEMGEMYFNYPRCNGKSMLEIKKFFEEVEHDNNN